MERSAVQNPGNGCAKPRNVAAAFPRPSRQRTDTRVGTLPKNWASMKGQLRVVVAGGGVAGLETLLALRALAGDRVALHLISPGDEFVYRPLEVLEPFDQRAMVRVPWARILTDLRVTHVSTSLRDVDLDRQRAHTTTAHSVPFDV